MITNGVSKSGETIDVVNDFSLHVPFEWCYDIDEYATNGAPVLKMFLPSERPCYSTSGLIPGKGAVDGAVSCIKKPL